MPGNMDISLDDESSSTASFEDVGRRSSEDLSGHKELVIRDPPFKAKENNLCENVLDVKYVLQYKGLTGHVVESRESDKPFDVAADFNDDEESSLNPVIEIVTTVSETVKNRSGHMARRPPPPPPLGGYDSQSEFDDDGFTNVKVKEVEKTEMIVHSKHLINAFNAVIGSYPGTNFLGGTVSIGAPYHALIHHRDALSRYRIAQPACHDDDYAATTAKHIDVLLSFLDTTYGEKVRDEEARHNRNPPAATFEFLWLVLKPGEIIYKELQNTWTPFVISHVDIERDADGKLLRYHVDCWDIRFSQGRMRRCMNVFVIGAFSGEQVISTLEVVPAAFFPEDLQKQDGLLMSEKQIAIGKMYWELVKRPAYKEYDGEMVDRDATRTGHVTGRVIVDAEGYERFGNLSPDAMDIRRRPRHIHMPPPPMANISPPQPRGLLPQFSPHCNCKACNKLGRTSEAPGPFANFEDLNPLEDAPPRNDLYFLVCSPNIPAFILSDRRWGHVRIDKLSEVKCDTEAFKYLVLDDGVKLTVKALIGKFASNDGKVSPWPNDFVRNKGEGRIFLLHGSPGVGKTCTAECVAELTRRPLLSLTSGDISTSMSSSSVERNLNYFLTLGERYGALVLLDEADVYLEERRTRDLRRNGLVSIFLRALEYYRGVLFLTTNRVESFDPAFTSRIHVALHYKRLTDSDRARIWANNFDRLERDSQGKVYVTHGAREYVLDGEDENEANELRWNGREIRNALQTAVALAETEAEEEGLERVSLAARHLQQVVKMIKIQLVNLLYIITYMGTALGGLIASARTTDAPASLIVPNQTNVDTSNSPSGEEVNIDWYTSSKPPVQICTPNTVVHRLDNCFPKIADCQHIYDQYVDSSNTFCLSMPASPFNYGTLITYNTCKVEVFLLQNHFSCAAAPDIADNIKTVLDSKYTNSPGDGIWTSFGSMKCPDGLYTDPVNWMEWHIGCA